MDKFTEIEKLAQKVKEEPTNFQARRELATAFMENGFNEEALKELYYLLQTFPEDPRLHYNLGIVLENLKKPEKAIYSYQNALRLQPDEPDFMYNLGYAYAQNGDYDKAIELFHSVIEKEPEDTNSYFNLGYAYSHKNEYEHSNYTF